MNNEEFNLEQFVDMFDTAMSSDNPTVQKCFKNLLLVVAIAHAEDVCDKTEGPLRGLVRRVDELERKLVNLEYLQRNHQFPSVPSMPLTTRPYNNPYTNPYSLVGGNGYVQPNSGATSIN